MSKSIQNSSIWNSKPTKLAILVPTRDTVHSQFAYCLAQLIKTTSEAGIDTYLFSIKISPGFISFNDIPFNLKELKLPGLVNSIR